MNKDYLKEYYKKHKEEYKKRAAEYYKQRSFIIFDVGEIGGKMQPISLILFTILPYY